MIILYKCLAYVKREKHNDAFVPPKPKLLVIATST